MKYLREHKEKLLIILFCFLVSFIVLLFTSKCSFLYPFNDWVDANAFFTMGKSMMHGLVPYRDLFEQKGPLLYLIYGIGYFMSNTSFLGVFVLEVLFWTFSLYYSYKIITLYLPKSYAYIIIPIFTTLLCTSRSFVHGGGAEEFCLPFLMITLYYFLSHFKESEINPKRLIIAGLCAGCVLLIKYTLLGFWFGFMACIFFHMFFQKEYKKSITSCLYFLLGMFTPVIITLIYLGLNHAIKDFIDVYFVVNITAYNRNSANIFLKLFNIYKGFAGSCYNSGPFELVLVVFTPLFIFPMNMNKSGKKYLIIVYLFSILGIFFGLRFYKYYLFPLLIFMLISLIGLFTLLEKLITKLSKQDLIIKSLTALAIIISLICSYTGANYKEFRSIKKENLFQYKFSQIINQEPNPTILEMGYVDSGVYTMSGILPNTYYFERLNIAYENYPDNVDAMQKYIKEGQVQFVVYFTKLNEKRLRPREKVLFEKYTLLRHENVMYDGKKMHAYLFKLNS